MTDAKTYPDASTRASVRGADRIVAGVSFSEGDYHGMRTQAVENEHLRLAFLLDAGPRVVRLSTPGSANIFAETPEAGWETIHGDKYLLYGGHRLWTAPECVAEEQVPEAAPVTTERLSDGVEIFGGTVTHQGLTRSIRLRLDPDEPWVHVRHALHNSTDRPVEAAAWALSQLAVGGAAVLPQQQGHVSGPQLPNRNLVLWPFSPISDPRLELRDDVVRVHAALAPGSLKIGYFNRAGWVAYEKNGTVFRKEFAVAADKPHADFGCNVEVYVCDDFIELETLSPLREIAPGQTVEHDETWKVIHTA
jgi:hypothetical protein